MRSFFTGVLSYFGVYGDPRDLSENFLQSFLQDKQFLGAISLRMLDKHGVTAAQHMTLYREYARYMSLKATSTRDFEVPSLLVDEVWHEHLQFNKSYEDICRKVFGRVIYHHPAVPGEDKLKYDKVYRETHIRYREYFGVPPKEIWGDLPSKVPEASISKLVPRITGKSSKKKASSVSSSKASSNQSSTSSSSSDDGGIVSSIAAFSAITAPTETSSPSSYSPPVSSCGNSNSSHSSCGSSSSSSCGGGYSSSCGGGSGCGGS